MSPPFARMHGKRPRGPPPFLVQLLRAPLTINNIVAFLLAKSLHLAGPPPPPPSHPGMPMDEFHPHPPPGFGPGSGPHPHGPPPFDFGGPDHAFPGPHGPPRHGHHHHAAHHHCMGRMLAHLPTVLSILFAISIMHNILTVARMHRIRKSVFGESMCSMRRRMKRGEMSEEEREAAWGKMKEMGKKMPSVWIASADVILAVGFLGMWMLTILVGMGPKGERLGMKFGYVSVGALVAFILNLMIGVNGLKLWARGKKHQKEAAAASVEEAPKYADEKAGLLQN